MSFGSFEEAIQILSDLLLTIDRAEHRLVLKQAILALRGALEKERSEFESFAVKEGLLEEK